MADKTGKTVLFSKEEVEQIESASRNTGRIHQYKEEAVAAAGIAASNDEEFEIEEDDNNSSSNIAKGTLTSFPDTVSTALILPVPISALLGKTLITSVSPD